MIADASVEIPNWIAVVGGLLAIAATCGAGVAIFRQASIKASLGMIIEANEGLRSTNADLRAELALEKVKRAESDGRLSVFIDGLAERIIGAIVEAWERTHGGPTITNTHTVTHQEVVAP